MYQSFFFADLLQIKENSTQKKEPVGYPRNEWFYLEDNAIEDEAERKKNEMLVNFWFSPPLLK